MKKILSISFVLALTCSASITFAQGSGIFHNGVELPPLEQWQTQSAGGVCNLTIFNLTNYPCGEMYVYALGGEGALTIASSGGDGKPESALGDFRYKYTDLYRNHYR